MTKVLAYINLIRLEYSIINHFLITFLITNQVYSCNNSNKEPPAVRQDTVQTKYKKMAPPQMKSQKKMWREESKL